MKQKHSIFYFEQLYWTGQRISWILPKPFYWTFENNSPKLQKYYLVKSLQNRKSKQPCMGHEHKYFLYLYLDEKHIYILAHITIICPKGKATHICHKAETFTFLTQAENLYIPWRDSFNGKDWHNESISTFTPIPLPAIWIAKSDFSYIQLLQQWTLLRVHFSRSSKAWSFSP